MTDLYAEQHRTAEILADRVAALPHGNGAIVRLGGGVGTGRTTILDLTREAIKQKGLKPIVLPNEASEFETGARLLAHLADQTSASFFSGLDFDLLKTPGATWNEKFRHVNKFIRQHQDQIVLLCDEPKYWTKFDKTVQDVANSDVSRFSEWIFRGAHCRRIVTGGIPDGLKYIDTVFPRKIGDADAFLREPSQWDVAADIAASIADESVGEAGYRSVMEVRLSVAIAWLDSPQQAAEFLTLSGSATSLLTRLLDRLEVLANDSSRHEEICKAISRLTIGRCRWTDKMFRKTCPELTELDRSVIRNSLCEEWENEFSIHPMVRYETISRAKDRTVPQRRVLWRLGRGEREIVHRGLLKEHGELPAGMSLVSDLEYLTHWSLAGDNDLTAGNERIHFIEQLHEIGFSLSYRHRLHHKATEVYRLALSFDDYNARSHHYLAFNLDWNAEQPDQVEEHYLKAIQFDPQHPWYHSRWISYLITRGRNKAAREALREANDLIPVTEDSPDFIFLGLHQWVARWMLHWGELAMAEDVLKAIPPGPRNEGSVRRLFDLLASLQLAEQGIAVFPLSVPSSNWWMPAGHTGLPIELDGRPLTWKPARVDGADDEAIEFTVGTADERDPSRIEISELTLSRAEISRCAMDFDHLELSEGRFVELGFYRDLGLKKIGLHTELELRDADLIPLVPPPDRWYKRAKEQSWNDLMRQQD